VPDGRSFLRLLALAAFLLTVALALRLAELRPLVVVVVMVAALGLAWIVEWLSWRDARVPSRPAGRTPTASPRSTPSAVEDVQAPPPVDAPEPAPDRDPEPATKPVAEPAGEPEPAPASPPITPVPAPSPPPEPVRAPLRPVPPLPPAVPSPPPARPPAAASVVDIRRRATAQPRRWNLWDLERMARERSRDDPGRLQEWSYLFIHLRQFASADGSLPAEFDALVYESFGELLEQPGR
jgi:outer membrane biosynthesis protein TonB